MFHIFACLKEHKSPALLFDNSEPVFDKSCFQKCDWAEFYPRADEPILPNRPEMRGKSVTTSCFFRCRSCRMSGDTKIAYIRDYLHQSRTNSLVLKATEYRQNFVVWFGVCCDEYHIYNDWRLEVQDSYDRSQSRRPLKVEFIKCKTIHSRLIIIKIMH